MEATSWNCGKAQADSWPTHSSNRFTGKTRARGVLLRPRKQNDRLMKILLILYLSIVELAKQALGFPRNMFLGLNQKRHKIAPNDQEMERLDRLRHPSKYLGR
jgi:hypothetical protein